MKALKKIIIGIIFLSEILVANAQVAKILNANIISGYITPASLCNVTVINTFGTGQFIFEAVLLNSSGIPVLEIRSEPFTLSEGAAVSLNNKVNPGYVRYSNDYAGDYVNTHKSLPIGHYTYCCFLRPVMGNADQSSEEFCLDLAGDHIQRLNLTFPDDRDTIHTLNPLLIWNAIPMKINPSANEHYKIIVCEVNSDQDSEEAILINKPVLIEDGLKNTQLNFPPNEEKLKKGSEYAWQVHKIVNDEVVASSEVWTFLIDEPKAIAQSYVIPKKSQDAGFFYLRDKKFYIKFTEPAENNILMCSLKRADLKKSKSESTDIIVQYLGYNIYEINVEKLKLKNGSYTMEIMNHLKDKYYVKFYVESKL